MTVALRWQFLLPAAVFLGVALLLYSGLSLNPREIPTALKAKPVPEFSLPPLRDGAAGFSAADLRRDQVALVNVFASWCVPCRVEHPLLTELKRRAGVPVYGLNYKDEPANAAAFLADLGDPYDRIGADRSGRVGIDWGVYGVPETFVIGKDGRIADKWIGPLTSQAIEERILPLVRRLKAEG